MKTNYSVGSQRLVLRWAAQKYESTYYYVALERFVNGARKPYWKKVSSAWGRRGFGTLTSRLPSADHAGRFFGLNINEWGQVVPAPSRDEIYSDDNH